MVDIVNGTHPIVVNAGLSAGPMTFYDDSGNFTTNWVSNLAPGVELIAQVTCADSNDYAKIFAVETGTELYSGHTSSNRVVGFSITGSHTVTDANMTDEAWALYDAAIAWLDPPAPEMVAHWPLDEGAGIVAADVVGGNDGTLVGGVSWLAEGGVSFDNVDGSHIEVPHADVLDFGDVDFSISLMVRNLTPWPDGEEDMWIVKGTSGAPGTGNRYELFIDSSSDIRFSIDNDAVSKTVVEVPSTSVYTGEWVHVVAVRDAVNDLLSVYADGVLLGTNTDGSGDISSGEPLWIGESLSGSMAMSGDIADIRIFDVALTEDQIASIN
jgi:hypothetical protein